MSLRFLEAFIENDRWVRHQDVHEYGAIALPVVA